MVRQYSLSEEDMDQGLWFDTHRYTEPEYAIPSEFTFPLPPFLNTDKKWNKQVHGATDIMKFHKILMKIYLYTHTTGMMQKNKRHVIQALLMDITNLLDDWRVDYYRDIAAFKEAGIKYTPQLHGGWTLNLW